MASNLKTLVIGIGGTGTRIVRRLTDRWGTRPPGDVSIALIDALKKGPEVHVPVPAECYSGSDQVGFPAEWARMAGEPGSEVDQWWPSRVLPQARVGFHNGCGAIRANGRFYVVRQTDRVVGVIERAVARLTEARVLGADGQREGTQWEVYILCSLGNGTGGGCFMDVAAIAKDVLLRRGFLNPLVTGVFIPGSVTRAGSAGVDQDAMENRVAASGLASLIELQYEFNRDGGGEFHPPAPYRFVGWCGGQYREFLPAWGIEDPLQASKHGQPIDFAFVLDCVNRYSVLNRYDELLDASAEALTALIGGADGASRLLDVQVMCESGRRFGSVGTIAMEAPTALLVRYCASRVSRGALAWACDDRKIDPVRDADLIEETLPGGQGRLDRQGITVERAVDYFLDHVLDVKEGGANPVQQNDLFRRFDVADADLRAQFSQAQGGDRGLAAAPRQQVHGLAAALLNHLLGLIQDLPAKRERELQRLWERVPPADCGSYKDLGSLGDAGTRWLLEQRVARFVERGAFGPLVVWLTELRRQLELNVKSIYATEVREHLGSRESVSRSISTAELQGVIEELKAKSTSIFAAFQRAAIAAKSGQFVTLAERDFDLLLWQSKINAVLKFYEQLDTHAGLLLAGADRAVRVLGDEGLRRRFQAEATRIEQALWERSGGSKVVYVGCDDQVREGLVQALEQDEATGSRGMLRSLSPLLWQVFGFALGDGRNQVGVLGGPLGPEGVQALQHLDDGALRDRVGGALSEQVEERIRRAVAERADIDQLLVREARAKIEAWYRLYFRPSLDNLPLDQRARDALAALEAVVHDTAPIREQFAAYPEFEEAMYRRRDGKVEGAVMLFVQARVRNLVDAAQPLWNPMVPVNLRTLIQKKAFFNYNKHAVHVGQALGALSGRETVADQAGEFFPASRLECVTVELGGRLEFLVRDSELRSYRLAMAGMPDLPPEEPYRSWFASFNPHLTKAFESAGLRWLEIQEGQKRAGRGIGDKEGELVLALAELTIATHPDLLGYVERRGAHCYMRRVLAQRLLEDGRRAYSDFSTGLDVDVKVGPRGSRTSPTGSRGATARAAREPMAASSARTSRRRSGTTLIASSRATGRATSRSPGSGSPSRSSACASAPGSCARPRAAAVRPPT